MEDKEFIGASMMLLCDENTEDLGTCDIFTKETLNKESLRAVLDYFLPDTLPMEQGESLSNGLFNESDSAYSLGEGTGTEYLTHEILDLMLGNRSFDSDDSDLGSLDSSPLSSLDEFLGDQTEPDSPVKNAEHIDVEARSRKRTRTERVDKNDNVTERFSIIPPNGPAAFVQTKVPLTKGEPDELVIFSLLSAQNGGHVWTADDMMCIQIESSCTNTPVYIYCFGSVKKNVELSLNHRITKIVTNYLLSSARNDIAIEKLLDRLPCTGHAIAWCADEEMENMKWEESLYNTRSMNGYIRFTCLIDDGGMVTAALPNIATRKVDFDGDGNPIMPRNVRAFLNYIARVNCKDTGDVVNSQLLDQTEMNVMLIDEEQGIYCVFFQSLMPPRRGKGRPTKQMQQQEKLAATTTRFQQLEPLMCVENHQMIYVATSFPIILTRILGGIITNLQLEDITNIIQYVEPTPSSPTRRVGKGHMFSILGDGKGVGIIQAQSTLSK